MATDTATKQNDTKPATPAKPAAAKRKPASRTKAKTAAKSRTRTASRSRKPAAARTEPTPTPTAAPRTEAKALNGGQQLVAGVIDAQEKTVTAIVDYQTRAAELSQVPGAAAVADAQAQVLRSVTGAYASAARAFLK